VAYLESELLAGIRSSVESTDGPCFDSKKLTEIYGLGKIFDP
jgi:hypothetical protein